MRHISNRVEPVSFLNWKKKNGTIKWSEFSGSYEYNALKVDLIMQQNNMCCYCEVALTTGSVHIEHLQDQDRYPKIRFHFENLLASCSHSESCGHFKVIVILYQWYHH